MSNFAENRLGFGKGIIAQPPLFCFSAFAISFLLIPLVIKHLPPSSSFLYTHTHMQKRRECRRYIRDFPPPALWIRIFCSNISPSRPRKGEKVTGFSSLFDMRGFFFRALGLNTECPKEKRRANKNAGKKAFA